MPQENTNQPGPDSGLETPYRRAESLEAPGEPPKIWDRYRNLERVGSGGMGQVFKAWDPRLRRTVALKFLQQGSPHEVRRFLHEAQAQARVNHEHVCRIYEVDVARGWPFIAMQFIDGPTLRQAAPNLDLTTKLQLIIQVAEGLHAAHSIGLIHRDMKPTNILVELRPDGQPKAYVMDFGLARDQEGPGLTQAGMILGTPAYMAPEQIRGDETLDARADIYSLGVTLFEILTGQLPYGEGGSTQVMLRALQEETPSPSRWAAVPHDLETVVLYCLDKDPQRRYPSARALADDLRRFLDGRPVLAARPSLTYKMLKWYRRNRLLAYVGAFAVVATIGLGAWGAVTSLRARTQARLVERFATLTQGVEDRFRLSTSQPLHDLRADYQRVHRTMVDIGLEMHHRGKLAQIPGHVALGRALLLLDQPGLARERFEEAQRQGDRSPDTAVLRGIALARLLRRELEGLRGESLRQRRTELEASHRIPALRSLEECRAFDPSDQAYPLALAALLQGDGERARDLAGESRNVRPWHYESWVLEAEAWVQDAQERQLAGEYGAAEQALEEAGRVLASALEANRSSLPLLQLEALRRHQLYEARAEAGKMVSQGDSGVDSCLDRIQTGFPDHPGALFLRALHALRRASCAKEQGRDPRSLLVRARIAAESAVASDPKNQKAWRVLGSIEVSEADWHRSHGQDPGPWLTRAVAAFEQGLALGTTHDLLGSLGNAHHEAGAQVFASGKDPRPSLALARSYHQRAADLGQRANQHFNVAADSLVEADYRVAQDLSPLAILDEAVEATRRGATLNPKNQQAAYNLAGIRVIRSRWMLEHGQDPGTELKDGWRAARSSVDLRPDAAEGLFALADVALLQARWNTLQDLPPEPALQEARSALVKAARIQAGGPLIHALRGQVEIEAARSLRRRGLDPEEHLRAALQHLGRALALAPGEPTLHIQKAEAHSLSRLAGARARVMRSLADARTHNANFLPRTEKLARAWAP